MNELNSLQIGDKFRYDRSWYILTHKNGVEFTAYNTTHNFSERLPKYTKVYTD